MPLPPPTILVPHKNHETRFKQGTFELVLKWPRIPTQEERDAVRDSVCKQLGRKRLKANVQLPVEEGDFKAALAILEQALSRLCSPQNVQKPDRA